MIFTVKDQKYFVLFRYYEEPTKSYAALREGIKMQRVTEVVYGNMIGDNQEEIASMKAFCSHLDMFTKKRGRKEALIKLFRMLRSEGHQTPEWLQTKEGRYTFWSKYLNMVGV